MQLQSGVHSYLLIKQYETHVRIQTSIDSINCYGEYTTSKQAFLLDSIAYGPGHIIGG